MTPIERLLEAAKELLFFGPEPERLDKLDKAINKYEKALKKRSTKKSTKNNDSGVCHSVDVGA